MSNHFRDQLASRANWLAALVLFSASSGGCSAASDAGGDAFAGGPSGGSASTPGTAGRSGVAGSSLGSGGQLSGVAGSGTAGSASLTGAAGSASAVGGAFGAGGSFSAGAGTSSSGGTGAAAGHAGQASGSGGTAGHAGQASGFGGTAGHAGGQSTGGAGGASATWTEIYTQFLSNAQYSSNCNGAACHNPGKQKGYDFSSQANGYASVKKNTSQFVSVLSSGVMPQGKTKMPAADLAVVKAWVAAGALDN